MTYSIYHFFAHLIRSRGLLRDVKDLERNFPFDVELLSCRNVAVFPDMAIKINTGDELYTGGELVEIKDSRRYTVTSFNSTIPTGRKAIQDIVGGKHTTIREQMENAGDDVFSLPERDVFYLVRGRNDDVVKVCLVHGSFFETVPAEALIQGAFAQVIQERVEASDIDLPENFTQILLSIFSDQSSFSRSRNVENAAVRLRFRVMTEVKAEGNVLDPRKYPDIRDNTLNLLLPCDSEALEEQITLKVRTAMSTVEYNALKIFKIKHLFNGNFLVFQISLLT